MVFRRVTPPLPLAQQLAGELNSVSERLRLDAEHALAFWSAYKDIQPLLELVKVSWRDLRAEELLRLTPEQLAHATRTYEALEAFGLWLRQTQAMPATMEARLAAHTARLLPQIEATIEVMGGPPQDSPLPSWLETWRTLQR